jgi:predicted nucleic acid-binding protein
VERQAGLETEEMMNAAPPARRLGSRPQLHRAPSIPDLIIAATAELAGLTVLHLDKDFQFIAEITGQAAERLRVE